MGDTVFKILTSHAWEQAKLKGYFTGSDADLADGFIHLSTGRQIIETANKHFHGQRNLVVVAYRADDLADKLKWEVSRGGDLFPHYYGALPACQALWVEPAPLDEAGVPIMSERVLTC